MLKVVGASWYQTRISTYILMGSGILVIAAFFIAEMERPQFSGTYCATVYWSRNAGFKIEYWKQRDDLENIPKGVARTCYKDSTHENGWAQLEIETQRTYPDWVQAFGAGLLEGSLTWNNVHYQWTNTISSPCDRDENSQNFCTWIRDVLSSNYLSMKEMLKKRSIHDHYWHQIHLFYYQLEGLEAGWRKGAKRARSDLEDEIPFEDFLLMNAAADIQDLKIYFENFVMHQKQSTEQQHQFPEQQDGGGKNFFIPSATMLMKLIHSNNNDTTNGLRLLFGHSSAGSYSSMLRIQKRYKFHYHFTLDQKTNTIPGVDISFTGYPGVLASTDDFYVIKGRQLNSLIAGVTLKNENLQLWNSIDLKQIIPLSARVMAANRLSQSRRTWAKAMSRHPSTGSKQWIIIDLRKMMDISNLHSTTYSASTTTTNDANSIINSFDIISEENNNNDNHNQNNNNNFINKNSKGIIWIVEQLPGRLHAEDMTDNIMNEKNCYWFANGTPSFNEILDASKINSNDENVDNNFFTQSSHNINITNLEDVEYVLRTNAFRGDLLGEQSIPYGNIDIKLFAYTTKTGQNHFHAIAGPVSMMSHQYHKTKKESNEESIKQNSSSLLEIYNNDIVDGDSDNDDNISDRRSIRNDIRALAIMKYSNGPFKWSNVDDSLSDVKHEGHPDQWNFEKVSPKWAW